MTLNIFFRKSGLSIVLLFCIFSFVTSQDTLTNTSPDVPKTLFGSVKINTIGLYVAPEIQYGQLAGTFTGFRGASAMVLFDQKLAIGAAVSLNALNFRPTDISSDKSLRLSMRTIGAKVEYTLNPNSLVHLSFPLTLGVGRSSVDSVKYTRELPDIQGNHNHGFGAFGPDRFGSTFGFLQPGVHLDLNVFKYGKFYFGGSYRIATNVKNRLIAIYDLTTSQLSGLNLEAGLKLGLFNYKIAN